MTSLSQDIGKVLTQPRLRKQFNTLDVTPSTPGAFAHLIRSEIPKWRKVIEGAKITID